MMHRKWLLLLLAACMLLSSCGRKTPAVDHTTTTSATTTQQISTDTDSIPDQTTSVSPPAVTAPEQLEFSYGRLTIENRFAMINKNDIRFTLNFDKKIYAPGDDIVLLVYVANYTGAPLEFGLSQPVVSRQQLIRASLTYGDGTHSVPVTVDYTPEADLEGGKTELTIRDRKLLSATVTFHTSAFTDVNESVFSEQYANTYRMKFWFGENEYDYFIETPLNYAKLERIDASQLQDITLPESYVRLAGDVRFTVRFDRTRYGTDDDIHMHVTVENIGKSAISLYSSSDISQPPYYIRAQLTYGDQTAVRDDVVAPSEIVGLESTHRLEAGAVLERDVTFFTSEFTQYLRSVYHSNHRDSCVLRVWLLVAGGTCEITVPITYEDYTRYHYSDRELTAEEEAKAEEAAEPERAEAQPAQAPTKAETAGLAETETVAEPAGQASPTEE